MGGQRNAVGTKGRAGQIQEGPNERPGGVWGMAGAEKKERKKGERTEGILEGGQDHQLPEGKVPDLRNIAGAKEKKVKREKAKDLGASRGF